MSEREGKGGVEVKIEGGGGVEKVEMIEFDPQNKVLFEMEGQKHLLTFSSSLLSSSLLLSNSIFNQVKKKFKKNKNFLNLKNKKIIS